MITIRLLFIITTSAQRVDPVCSEWETLSKVVDVHSCDVLSQKSSTSTANGLIINFFNVCMNIFVFSTPLELDNIKKRPLKNIFLEKFTTCQVQFFRL